MKKYFLFTIFHHMNMPYIALDRILPEQHQNQMQKFFIMFIVVVISKSLISNLFQKVVSHYSLICDKNEVSGELFSFQVNNILK